MNVGFALCGSFCTFQKVFPAMEAVASIHKVIPIFSHSVCTVSSRFGTPEEYRERTVAICGSEPLTTLEQVEPIGPKHLLDALIIAPCTGNTLAKLSCGIADTAVTMAAKSHLRNGRPVVVAISTNDGLAGAAENIGHLLARKNYYFVPYGQDDSEKKPTSLVAHFEMIPATVDAAVLGKQIQPLIQ